MGGFEKFGKCPIVIISDTGRKFSPRIQSWNKIKIWNWFLKIIRWSNYHLIALDKMIRVRRKKVQKETGQLCNRPLLNSRFCFTYFILWIFNVKTPNLPTDHIYASYKKGINGKINYSRLPFFCAHSNTIFFKFFAYQIVYLFT